MKAGGIEPISSGQLFWLVAVSVVAGGVYIWPETVAAESGANALWGILLAVILALVLLSLEVAFARRVGGVGCADRLFASWGGLAWMWLGGTLVLCIAVDAAVLTMFSQFLQVFFYPTTSPWIVRALLMAVATWVSVQSLPTLARTVQFWFPLVLLSFFLLAALAAPELRHLSSLRPAWPPDPAATLAGLLATWYLWVQGDLAVSLASSVRTPGLGGVGRTAQAAYLFQGAMLLLIWALVLGTLGAFAPQILEWPMPYIFANLGPESFFVARPGILILSTWAIAVLLYLAVRLYCTTWNLQLALHLAADRRVRLAVPLAAVIFALASLLGPPGRVTWFVVHEVDPAALLFFVARAVLSYARARRRLTAGAA